MDDCGALPQATGAAAGAAPGSAGRASVPRTAIDLARAYLECKLAFVAVDEATTVSISYLDVLCPSMLLIAGSKGACHPARPGSERHQFDHFSHFFFCSRGRGRGVRDLLRLCSE